MSKTLETSIEISGVLSPSLQSAIKNAVGKLEEMSKETLAAAGAAEKLAAEIGTQESVLESLERGYADFIVSGEEGTEGAQALAQQIQDLSSELDENRGTLEAAQQAAEKLASGMDNTENEADQLRNTISQQESTLEKLKEKYVALALSENDTGDESQELAQQIQELSSNLSDNRERLSEAERAADDLDNSLERVDESAQLADKGFTVFKATLANLAADAIRSAIDGIKDLIGNVMELGKNFTSTMSEVQAISGASGEELETLEACAREYGATTVFSASESAEALKYMALAGWDVEQSTSALGGVLNLAAASGMDLGAASDMVTDYLSAFGMEASDAAYFADMLSYAQSSSNTTAEALGEAYKNCAANLNAAGQDVETVTSLLEGMANQGYKGSEAGTALAAIMRDITNAMDNGAIQIGDTTVAVMDAKGNFRDLTDIITDVSGAVDGMGTAERATALSSTFTADSTKGLNLILNEGIDKIAGYEEELREAGGTAEEMADIMNDNLSGDMAQMNSAWEELGLKIYDHFEGSLRSAVQFITASVIPGIEWLLGHLPELGVVLSAVGAVIAAIKWQSLSKKLTMVKGAIQGVIGAIGGISAPALAIGAVIAALILAFANLWKNNEEFRDRITAIWDGVKQKFDEFGQGIVDRLNALGFDFENITEVLGAIWDGFCTVLAPIFEGAFQAISTILSTVLDVITGIFDVFSGIFTGNWDLAWQGVKEIFSGIWDGITNIFQTITDTLTGVADAFLGLFGTNWETVWNSVKGFFEGIWNGIKGFFEGIWNGIISFFTGKNSEASENTSSVWEGISSFLGGILSGIQSVFETVWGAISGVVETVMGVISGIINTIMSIIQGDWSGAWEGIKGVASTVWDGISSTISGAWNGISSFLGGAVEGLGTTLSGAWEGIKSTATTAWEGIKTGVSTAWEGLKSAVSTGAETLGTTLSTTWETVKTTASTAWDNIKTTASTAWEGISSAASSAWDGISSFFGGIWDGITGKTESSTSQVASTSSTAWNGVASDAEAALNGVSETVNSAWDGIQNSVSAKISALQSTMLEGMSAVGTTLNTAWTGLATATSTAWEGVSAAITGKLQSTQASVITGTAAIRSSASAAWAGISSATTTAWGTVQITITTKMRNVQTTISTAMSGIKSTMNSNLTGALNTVNSTFSSILSTVTNKMQAANSAVHSAISAMQSAFNFSWSLPHLAVPHVNVSGSFSINPPSAPNFSVSWYKEGGILTQPTIFGAAGNRLLAGGEAGAEAVVPLATLWDKLETMIGNVFNNASSTGGSSDEGLTSKAGQLLTLDNFSLGSLADSGGVVIYYDFSNFTWSPQIQTGGAGDNDDDLMAQLRAHEAEFFDWLEEFIQMREVAQYA